MVKIHHSPPPFDMSSSSSPASPSPAEGSNSTQSAISRACSRVFCCFCKKPDRAKAYSEVITVTPKTVATTPIVVGSKPKLPAANTESPRTSAEISPRNGDDDIGTVVLMPATPKADASRTMASSKTPSRLSRYDSNCVATSPVA